MFMLSLFKKFTNSRRSVAAKPPARRLITVGGWYHPKPDHIERPPISAIPPSPPWRGNKP